MPTCTLRDIGFHFLQIMKAPEVSQVVLAIAIFLAWIVFYFVKKNYGTAVAFHWMGYALLVIAIAMATRPSISIYSGFRKVGDLRGWKKAIVIVPICVLACVFLTR